MNKCEKVARLSIETLCVGGKLSEMHELVKSFESAPLRMAMSRFTDNGDDTMKLNISLPKNLK